MMSIVEAEVELVNGYPQAQVQAEEILDAYLCSGEAGIDQVFLKMDDSWFSGISLYLAEDIDSILYSLENDTDDEWRLPDNKKATIAVGFKNGTFAAIVYSFP